MPHHTATKGNIGVAKATADLLAKGWDVLMPICSTSPFDLVLYRGGRFLRVQVKYRTPVSGVLPVDARRHTIIGGRVRKSERNIEIDWVCAYDGENDRCYYVPASRCPINLRIVPTRSGQVAKIFYAVDFVEIY